MSLLIQIVRCFVRSASKVLLGLYVLVALPLHLQAAELSRNTKAKRLAVAVEQKAVASRLLTLKQLGARYPIVLRGVDGRGGIGFSVRADEVVTKALLKVVFSYSPAMLTEVSHINVLVNGEVAASLQLPKERSPLAVERVVDLPPKYLTEYNKIDFQLIGHYSTQCEDPAHSSLWASISNLSTLEVTSEPVTLSGDLKYLPLPFMDQRDPRKLQLPFVFFGKTDDAVLEAAGNVSSWFGLLAGQRGADFPVSLNAIPAKGNAVVFFTRELPLAGVSPSSVTAPALSIVMNPNDPDGKLLLISGSDGKDVRIAAMALTTRTDSLQGDSMLVKPLDPAARRLPYDAPRWLSSHRPVKFSEISNASDMNVAGHNPGAIRLNMRVPPDLFRWNDAGIPVNLNYRYTPQVLKSADSSLLVSFNEQLVRSLPLFPVDRLAYLPPVLTKLAPNESLSTEKRLNVPMYMVAHQSQMQLDFKFDYSKEGECRDVIVDNMRGSIEPDSTIDFSAYPHYLKMPDLAVFRASGFPFTRLADLSETAVILSDVPTVQEFATYLGLMGRMGESTGYPAIGVSVAHAGQIETLSGKDLLLISSGDNQPLLKTWRKHLQFHSATATSMKLFGMEWNPFMWGTPSSSTTAPSPSSEVLFEGMTSRTVMLGFESPLARGRSAVLLWSAQPEALNDALAAMFDSDAADSPIRGALSVIRGKSVNSLATESGYYVGDLPWLTYVRWRLSGNFALFLVISLASAMLFAAVLYAVLMRKARDRLQ